MVSHQSLFSVHLSRLMCCGDSVGDAYILRSCLRVVMACLCLRGCMPVSASRMWIGVEMYPPVMRRSALFWMLSRVVLFVVEVLCHISVP